MTRFYAYLLLMADRDPDGILNHADRARDVVRATRNCGVPTKDLEQAAAKHAKQRGRAAFTRVGRELCAVDADGDTCYPHTQTAKDLKNLTAAQAALAADKPRRAAQLLIRVGDNSPAPYVGREVYAIHHQRRIDNMQSQHWIASSHLAASPDLWEEIAALRGDPDARKPGPWIDRSIARHIAKSRKSLTHQIRNMQRTLERTGPRT